MYEQNLIVSGHLDLVYGTAEYNKQIGMILDGLIIEQLVTHVVRSAFLEDLVIAYNLRGQSDQGENIIGNITKTFTAWSQIGSSDIGWHAPIHAPPVFFFQKKEAGTIAMYRKNCRQPVTAGELLHLDIYQRALNGSSLITSGASEVTVYVKIAVK